MMGFCSEVSSVCKRIRGGKRQRDRVVGYQALILFFNFQGRERWRRPSNDEEMWQQVLLLHDTGGVSSACICACPETHKHAPALALSDTHTHKNTERSTQWRIQHSYCISWSLAWNKDGRRIKARDRSKKTVNKKVFQSESVWKHWETWF